MKFGSISNNASETHENDRSLHQNALQFTMGFIKFWMNLDIITTMKLINPPSEQGSVATDNGYRLQC
jgi:hypothetical protein